MLGHRAVRFVLAPLPPHLDDHGHGHDYIYNTGLERLGLTADSCIAFEDSFSGLASAQAAGLRTVGVLTCRTEEEMLTRGAFMAVANFEAEGLWRFLKES